MDVFNNQITLILNHKSKNMKKTTIKNQVKKPKLEKRTISLLNRKDIAVMFGGAAQTIVIGETSMKVPVGCTGTETEKTK